MTNREAIKILRNGLANAPTEHDWCIAFKMAIKALEQVQYYKDLANSYEKTINKLTKAISEQEPKTDVLDKIRADVQNGTHHFLDDEPIIEIKEVLQILDKYRQEG